MFYIPFPEPVHIYNNHVGEKVTFGVNFLLRPGIILHKDSTLRQASMHSEPDEELMCDVLQNSFCNFATETPDYRPMNMFSITHIRHLPFPSAGVLAALLCMTVLQPSRASGIPQHISISSNHRCLVDQEGKPFFYLADTAWELFHRLSREEAELYLRDRAHKGFTVIQAVAVAELDGISTPNAYGFLPFENQDPSRPAIREGASNDYWDHVDYIVSQANSLGLYIAMLPTWGRYWRDGDHPPFNPQNARSYGYWLGQRYQNAQVIWVLGGDRNPDNEQHRTIIREMARGLREGDHHRHLITYHPTGWCGSAQFFHNEDWLDFNMRQNGHNHWAESYKMTLDDWNRNGPVKPVLDGEPIYEDHPVAFDAGKRGHSVAADCRRALYWDLFNGACGHTYGHHSVWQMWDPDKSPYPVNNPLMPWKEAIQQPGAAQMQWGKKLLLSRPFLTRIPATEQVMVPSPIPSAWPGEGLYRFAATMDTQGTYLMVYVPAGRRFTINTTVIRGEKLKGWWYDPRTGRSHKIGKVEHAQAVSFISPTPGEELDWVLVIDDASMGYRKP